MKNMVNSIGRVDEAFRTKQDKLHRLSKQIKAVNNSNGGNP